MRCDEEVNSPQRKGRMPCALHRFCQFTSVRMVIRVEVYNQIARQQSGILNIIMYTYAVGQFGQCDFVRGQL